MVRSSSQLSSSNNPRDDLRESAQALTRAGLDPMRFGADMPMNPGGDTMGQLEPGGMFTDSLFLKDLGLQ